MCGTEDAATGRCIPAPFSLLGPSLPLSAILSLHPFSHPFPFLPLMWPCSLRRRLHLLPPLDLSLPALPLHFGLTVSLTRSLSTWFLSLHLCVSEPVSLVSQPLSTKPLLCISLLGIPDHCVMLLTARGARQWWLHSQPWPFYQVEQRQSEPQVPLLSSVYVSLPPCWLRLRLHSPEGLKFFLHLQHARIERPTTTQSHTNTQTPTEVASEKLVSLSLFSLSGLVLSCLASLSVVLSVYSSPHTTHDL